MKLLSISGPSAEDPDSHTMPLLDHLLELRTRLVISAVFLIVMFGVCAYFSKEVYGFLVEPLAKAMARSGNSTNRMIFTSPTEGFVTYMQVAFFAAVFISFPVFAHQLWKFIAPGLYKHEKRALLPFLVASPVLFFAGGALLYYMILPRAWGFLLGFQSNGADTVLPIQMEAKVADYLSIVMRLIFAFGLSFEFPLLLILLARVGIISSKTLIDKWRWAVIGVFVFAAIVTPPDVISQIGLAIPMLALYALSIWGAKWVEKKRDETQAANVTAPGIEDTDFNDA